MIALAKRNVKLYFRDKLSVFFSLLSVIILILLYALFLGSSLERSLDGLPDGNLLISSWLFSGTITVATLTTALAAYDTMVNDRFSSRSKDFTVSPIKRSSLAGGYILSALFIGTVMSVVTAVGAQIIMLVMGGSLLPITEWIRLIGYIVLAVSFAAPCMFFVCSFLKTNGAFSTLSTLVGTLIGFLTGLYMPIGELPAMVQPIVRFFPPSHAGVLIRDVLMKEYIQTTFAGAPDAVVEAFKLDMGIIYRVGDTEITPLMSIGYLLACAVLFFALSVWRAGKKEK